jgi:PAS domain S-box-containing protein
VALATWLKYLAQPQIIPSNVPILYIVAIVVTAFFFGFIPAILCCILSLLAFNFFFISPAAENIPILLIFLLIGATISYLESNLRRRRIEAMQEALARKQAEEGLQKLNETLENRVIQRTRELSESERHWSTTIASIGDGVIATDATGNITFMNAVAVSLTGWTQSEAISRPVNDVFSIINKQTRQRLESPVDIVLQKGSITGLANHTVLLRKDGTEIPIDDSGAPIKGEDGIVIGVVLVFRDVTERRKAEQVKDDFIGMVSHELRTPLTVVTGSIRTAMSAGISTEDIKMLLENAASGAEELEMILSNLLELSRYQADRLNLSQEQVDLAQLIRQVVDKTQSQYQSHHFIFDTPPGIPPMSADRLHVERIMRNLLDNAAKYSPGGY